MEIDQLIVQGGNILKGEIETSASKNSALSILSACLMTNEKSTLKNVPKIEDLERMLEIFNSIGVKTTWLSKTKLMIEPPKKLNLNNIDRGASEKMRSAILLFSSLASRQEKFNIPMSGGCSLGKRTIEPHLAALENYGINIEVTENDYKVSRGKYLKTKGKIVMLEASDTGTEIAIMGAVLAKGLTIIKNASYNYMVQDTCYALMKMGADIEGVGTDTLKIKGIKTVRGLKDYSIMYDPIVAFSFIAMSVATKSEIIVNKVPIDFIELELEILRRMGQKMLIVKKYKKENFNLVDIKFVPSNLKAMKDKIHPALNFGHGVNNDNFPIFSIICLGAKGESLLCDWGYEGRQQHFYELKKMGAKVAVLDVHRAMVFGDQKPFLKGTEIDIPYLRAGIILLIAALTAKGKTILNNAYQIRRGYAGILEKLELLGADIKKNGR